MRFLLHLNFRKIKMLYYLGIFFGTDAFQNTPLRLFRMYSVLIVIALYAGFLSVRYLLPLFYKYLPSDRGRDFTLSKEVSKGKPTGAGVFFVTVFVILSFLLIPLNYLTGGILFLTWCMMLTGYLDDRSEKGWGEYIKAFLDFVIVTAMAVIMAHALKQSSPDGQIHFWFPFIKSPVAVPAWLYVIITIILLWVSVNTTNCTDGVDGLSSSLVLIGLLTMGTIFYILLGHANIAASLHVPQVIFDGDHLGPYFDGKEKLGLHLGAHLSVMCFSFAGVVMGYLWHNSYPSSVLMGDAGSRALGFFTGVCVLLSGNPLMFLATSTIICINGGLGLLKVALKRFLHISILTNIRFPLHDHMRKNHGWSPTQVLIKFMLIQIMISIAVLGIFFKIR